MIWALLFALAIALVTAPRAHKLDSPDFKVFYAAARHVLTDPVNLYKISPDRYLYPPSAAILLTPFAFSANYHLHQWIWHGLLALIVFALGFSGMPALAALLLLTRYLAITFGYGQINLVEIGLMALAGAWLLKASKRAGAAWALAASIKIYPLVLAPAFFSRSRWKGLVMGAVVALLVAFLPFLLFGFSLGGELYGEFLGALRSKGMPLHSHNQSFAALLLRLFTDQSFYLHAVGDTKWALLGLPQGLVTLFAWLLGISLTAFTWKKAWGRPERYLSAAAFSILFLSHIVWKDYLLFLYFPLREIFSLAPKKKSLWLAGGFLALVTLSSPDLIGAPLSTRLDAACIHLWAAILVWGAWCKE
jgi:hypothetical protein